MSNLFSVGLVAYVVYLIAFAICGLAVWKGDRPLQLAAAILLVAWTLSALMGERDVYGMNYPVTVIDTNCALAFIWISLRWRRLWCAVLAALMIVEVIIPLVAFFDRDIHRYEQATSNNIVALLVLAVLVVALWQVFRARHGPKQPGSRPDPDPFEMERSG